MNVRFFMAKKLLWFLNKKKARRFLQASREDILRRLKFL